MIRPKIGLDWDDVTAPFNSLAIKMANDKYNIDPPLSLHDVTSWENTGRASVIKEFYSDEGLYKMQSRSIEDTTKKMVEKLEEIADVYFVTAVSPEFMGVRARQIKETFPYLPDNRIILGAAKHLIQFDIILDDNACNVLESPASFPVLMRKPWNRNITGILSVNSMEEFLTLVEHILTEKKEPKRCKGQIVALVGPSGSGKQQIAKILSENYSEIFANPTSYTGVLTKNFLESEHDIFESTVYAGNTYWTRKSEIEDILNKGMDAIIPLDMCGAIGAKRQFPTTIVYVNRRKDEVIRNILNKDISDEEKTLRILSIEAEKKNAALCDVVLNSNASKMDDYLTNMVRNILQLFQ